MSFGLANGMVTVPRKRRARAAVGEGNIDSSQSTCGRRQINDSMTY